VLRIVVKKGSKLLCIIRLFIFSNARNVITFKK